MPTSSVARSLLVLSPVGLVLLPATALALPQLAFDSWNGTNSSSVRAAGDSPGSQITVANGPKTISNIAVRVDLNSAGNLKFVIFSHPGHVLLYASPPKNFADDGMTWKQSDALNFVLAPGTYDIGAIADVGGTWQFDTAPAAMGDFSSVVSNPNFLAYNAPTAAGHGGADGAVQLYIDSAVCGDGVLAMDEECDDGNADNTDACLVGCVAASCGDGFVWAGVEACDDGNADNTDACLVGCVAASCGDGFVWAGVEECDDGNDVDSDCGSEAAVQARSEGIAGGLGRLRRVVGIQMVTASSGGVPRAGHLSGLRARAAMYTRSPGRRNRCGLAAWRAAGRMQVGRRACIREARRLRLAADARLRCRRARPAPPARRTLAAGRYGPPGPARALAPPLVLRPQRMGPPLHRPRRRSSQTRVRRAASTALSGTGTRRRVHPEQCEW